MNTALLNEDLEIEFSRILRNLYEDYGCSYMFYLNEFNNHRISFSSNAEWYELYVGRGLISHCPLLKITEEKIKKNGRTKPRSKPNKH